MNYYLILICGLFLYMNFWFVISLLKKRNDVADIAWGLGFVFIVWFAFVLHGSTYLNLHALLANILITIWGFRLSYHIYKRNKNKEEDYRYKKWREEWGSNFIIRSYLQVYMLQGFLLFIIALPAIFINQSFFVGFNWSIVLGLAVWIIGFIFESVGDSQLADFIKNPDNKGKLLKTGLWKYTRHPNYFGEVTQWWGIWLMTILIPYGYLFIVGPILITYLIRYVSGVPMLEKKMELNPDFVAYKNSTSVFFPWFPKI